MTTLATIWAFMSGVAMTLLTILVWIGIILLIVCLFVALAFGRNN